MVVGTVASIVELNSSSEVERKDSEPNDFILSQNYPNPFNPSTKINFSVPAVTLQQAQNEIYVTLKVYDVLGNEIATLVNEDKSAGSYEAEFKIHSCKVRNMPSGIYFYTLRAGSFTQTKKMILLK